MALDPDMPVDLVLVRHGESEGNLYDDIGKQGKVLGKESAAHALQSKLHGRHTSQWRLTDLGRKQATRAGKLIQREILQKEVGRFDKFYCSSYTRAMETAGFMDLPHAQFLINVFIREKDSAAEWRRAGEGPDEQEMAQLSRRSALSSFYGDGVGMESPADLLLRVRIFLSEMHQTCSGQRVVIVCHRHVMKAFEFILKNVPPDKHSQEWSAYTPNCLIQWYSRRDKQGHLRSRICRCVSFVLKDVKDMTADNSEADVEEEDLRTSTLDHQMTSEDLRCAAFVFPQKLNNEDMHSLCNHHTTTAGIGWIEKF